jgi:hypothetical protein
MPTRRFSELLEELPAERQDKIDDRVRKSLASVPLVEIGKARQMTQAKLSEALGVKQGEVSKIEQRTDRSRAREVERHSSPRVNLPQYADRVYRSAADNWRFGSFSWPRDAH